MTRRPPANSRRLKDEKATLKPRFPLPMTARDAWENSPRPQISQKGTPSFGMKGGEWEKRLVPIERACSKPRASYFFKVLS